MLVVGEHMAVSEQSTVGSVLNAATSYLADKGIENPDLVCSHLLSCLLDCRHLDLHLHSDQVLDEKRLEAMRRGIKRAAGGEPVQYIVGHWDLMGHKLKVDRRALIPRPETEILVQRVLDCDDIWNQQAPLIADVGTGSGCIVIALAVARPNAAFVALDPSSEALELAKENAEALGVADRIAFAPTELSDVVDPESLAAIVANLPYIPTTDYEQLSPSIRDFEPRSALDGGDDGLDIIRSVVQDATMALKNGGMISLEIGAEQGNAVKSLLEAEGFSDVSVLPDLASRDRVVEGRFTLEY